MSLFDKAVRDHRERNGGPDREARAATVVETDKQTIGSGTFAATDAEESDTVQPVDEDSWLNVSNYGIPRGVEAYEAAQVGSTAPFEMIKNVVNDQITGGAFVYESEGDDEPPDDILALQDVFTAVLEGPHLMGDDFDDLVTAAIADMLDLGHGYWEALAAEGNENEFPVRKLKPVPALTVQHNVDEYGNWEDPPYYQAPFQSFAGGTIAIGDIDPVGLSQDELVTLQWPGSRRADRVYPMSPAMQVTQWLELLKNSTTHHGRFYNDDEIPAGLLSVIEANQTDVDSIKKKIEDASGDPRTAPVVGSEANWIDIGGTAINLDIIEEQKWFLQLCWGSLGLNKAEIGLIEDVNRSANAEQSQTIYKRITMPVTTTIEQAVNRQIFSQFDAYNSLDTPFKFHLDHADPVRERQRQERLNNRWENGSVSFNEQATRRGEDPGDTEVTLPNGEEFDYGPHPKYIGKILINAYKANGMMGGDQGNEPGADPGPDVDPEPVEDDEDEDDDESDDQDSGSS